MTLVSSKLSSITFSPFLTSCNRLKAMDNDLRSWNTMAVESGGRSDDDVRSSFKRSYSIGWDGLGCSPFSDTTDSPPRLQQEGVVSLRVRYEDL